MKMEILLILIDYNIISSIDLTNNTGSTIPLVDTYVLANAKMLVTIILEVIILVVLARLSLI